MCVGTIRGNRLEGASSIMKTKRQLEKEGRGSMDYRLDANSSITLLRWLKNGLIQLISSFVGPEFDPPVRRWSGKKKKIGEVTCPEIFHQYNLHMDVVDKNDMLLSLYRLNHKNQKVVHALTVLRYWYLCCKWIVYL